MASFDGVETIAPSLMLSIAPPSATTHIRRACIFLCDVRFTYTRTGEQQI